MWQARCEALLTHLPLLHMPGRHSPTHASSVQAVEGSYFKQPLTSHQGREISSSLIKTVKFVLLITEGHLAHFTPHTPIQGIITGKGFGKHAQECHLSVKIE
jgi:hypothetical protein